MSNLKQINHNRVSSRDLLVIKQAIKGTTYNHEISVSEFLKLIKTSPATTSSEVVIKKGGSTIGSQPNLNFIEGTNITLGILQNTSTSSIDITVNAAGGATGGQVDSVVGTVGQIEVDDTDPENPVLSLATEVTDAIAGKLDIADFVEEKVVGTATYNAAMTGTVNLDLSTFTDVYGILTGNTTITVSETPVVGKSFVRSATIKSTTSESLTLPVGWIVKGAYNADGTENDLEIKFTNYPTVGLKVWCYINGAT